MAFKSLSTIQKVCKYLGLSYPNIRNITLDRIQRDGKWRDILSCSFPSSTIVVQGIFNGIEPPEGESLVAAQIKVPKGMKVNTLEIQVAGFYMFYDEKDRTWNMIHKNKYEPVHAEYTYYGPFEVNLE